MNSKKSKSIQQNTGLNGITYYYVWGKNIDKFEYNDKSVKWLHVLVVGVSQRSFEERIPISHDSKNGELIS